MSRTFSERHAYRLRAEAEVAGSLVGAGPALCVCGAALPERTGRWGVWFCSDACKESVIWGVVRALLGETPTRLCSDEKQAERVAVPNRG